MSISYRFSSWASDNPDNVALWEDEQGELLAWAVLHPPFWAIDYACHPAAPVTLPKQILTWIDQQAQANRGSAYYATLCANGVTGYTWDERIDLLAVGAGAGLLWRGGQGVLVAQDAMFGGRLSGLEV